MKYPFDVCYTKTEYETRWIARSKFLPYTIGIGETMDEAIKLLEELEELVLQPCDEKDTSVPPLLYSSDDLIIRLGDYELEWKQVKEIKRIVEDFLKRQVDIIH